MIRRYSLIGVGLSLDMGFEVSKTILSSDSLPFYLHLEGKM